MWYYQDEIIDILDKFPKNTFGFVYKITNICETSPRFGYFYIGKKQLWSERNVKLSNKELAIIAEEKRPGKKPSKKKVIKESDWLKYYGSEPEIKKDIQEMGKDNFKREIICFAFSKKQLTYLEIKNQMIFEVLEKKNTYNSNIEGRYFKKDFADWIY